MTKISDLTKDPLLGCDRKVHTNDGWFNNLADRIELEMALYSTRAFASQTLATIVRQSAKYEGEQIEYIVNELQYEKRICDVFGYRNLDKKFEEVVLKNRMKYLIKVHGEDKSLDLLSFIISRRKNRKRFKWK